jgi:hypothetical protein
MAERRMFTKKIIDSDAFLDMPLSTQALYFHLNMRADDDGFINNPKKIMRMIGASEDDIKLLITKRFIIIFDSGVVVVKHWRMHNLLRKDRYTETQYVEEKSMLFLKENGVYTEDGNQVATERQPNGNTGKGSIVEDSIGEYRVVEVSDNGNQESDSAEDENVDNYVDNFLSNYSTGSNLEYMGGTLGKGVVLLTDDQKDALFDILGFDAFNHYIERLATWIIQKNAVVGNHYQTILKWYEEDKRL